MAEIEHSTSVGQTGGLPGNNAAPATRLPTDDDVAAVLPVDRPGSSTDDDSGDDGSTAEGDAYDEPDIADGE